MTAKAQLLCRAAAISISFPYPVPGRPMVPRRCNVWCDVHGIVPSFRPKTFGTIQSLDIRRTIPAALRWIFITPQIGEWEGDSSLLGATDI